MANPRVKVLEGELEGSLETSLEGKQYYSFKGIPYAEPPLGDLRFKPPVPKKPWSGVRDSTQESDPCAQFEVISGTFLGSEDCLFLNVFTPRLPRDGEEDELLPVMFYIHAGGFINGTGSADWTGPDFIVAKDTIMVTINYRLAALGFLCLDIPEAPGNVGLRDQSLALKWVQQNIRAFNGDPDNVTIFGISAGSASVEYHMLSPMSEGLFQKAILQSGSVLNPWARMRNPSKLAEKLSESLGAGVKDPVQLLKYLQDVDLEKLVVTAFQSLDDDDIKSGEMFAFVPVVEKTISGVEPFLNVEPLDLLSSGKFYRVPTITGFCENEGALFQIQYIKHINNLKQRKFIDYLPASFEVDRVHYDVRLREMYDQKDDTEAMDAFLSDLLFVGGINQSLNLRLHNNHMENYVYLFAFDGSLNFVKIAFDVKGKGAFHGDDSSYLTSSVFVNDIPASAADVLVRSRMVQMWTDFAKYGNPTPEQTELITTEWLPATSHHTILMEITKDLKITKFPFLERMIVWESLYNSLIIPRSRV